MTAGAEKAQYGRQNLLDRYTQQASRILDKGGDPDQWRRKTRQTMVKRMSIAKRQSVRRTSVLVGLEPVEGKESSPKTKKSFFSSKKSIFSQARRTLFGARPSAASAKE